MTPARGKTAYVCTGPQPLIDTFLLESVQSARRKVVQPKRDLRIPNPLITGNEDHCYQPFFTVLRDAETGRFRIWYGVWGDRDDVVGSHIGYMESEDGLHWIRPHRVLKDPGPIQFGSEVIDEGPAYPDQTRRYKYGWWYGGGLRIAVSSDGLKFRPLVDRVVLRHNHDINNISWDPLRNCYVATISVYMTDREWTGYRRITMQSFSHDLIDWTEPWFVLRPDKTDEGETQFYGMSAYLTRGPLKIGMVKVLRDDIKADEPPLIDPDAYGIGYTVLAWTRDGIHWTRDREIFFDRNTEPRTWDRAHSWIDEQVIVGDEVYLYYGGYKQGHKKNRFSERQIGIVKMPLDRYVAWVAEGEEVGILLTIPLRVVPPADRLTLNTDAASGSLSVQILDADSSTVIPGLGFDEFRPITSDGLRLEAVWGDKQQTRRRLSSLRDKEIRVQFRLINSRLFAFEFTNQNES